MYEEYEGKKVKITFITAGRYVTHCGCEIVRIEGNFLHLRDGRVIDADAEDFVKLEPDR